MDDRVQIRRAWDSCIAAYKNHVIVSEHTLQAAFYRYLCEELKGLKVVCEPRIEARGIGEAREIGPYYPDILILDDRAITAAIEIKYVPQGYPVFQDDLEKLRKYATTEREFPILLDPDTGHSTDKLFPFDPSCLLVFAVIGKHGAEAVDTETLSGVMGEFRDRFLPLVYSVGTAR